MKITAQKIINRALSMIGVKTTGVDLTQDEINDGIEVLNDLMMELDSKGLRLGYSSVVSSSDVITTPDWCHAMMKAQLAIRLASEYDRPLTPALVNMAQESLLAVRKRVVQLDKVSFPSTLPVGAGNQWQYGDDYYPFFPDQDDNDLLYENKQSATTVDNQQIDVDMENKKNVN